MRKGFLSAVVLSMTGASLALAQSPNGLPYSQIPSGQVSLGTIGQSDAPARGSDPETLPFPSKISDGAGPSCNGDPCWTGGNVCGPPGRFWVSAEYLLWWIKDSRLPPLVTTGPADPRLNPPPGAIGANGTVVLFGDEGAVRDPFSGLRVTAGFWLDCGQTKGIEASYFDLASRSKDFTATSSGAAGSVVLARPFFDVSTGLPNSELVAFPGVAGGTIHVQTSSRLQGPEANLLCNLCCSCNACCDCCQPAPGYRVDLITGVRYLDLKEGLGIREDILVSPNSPAFTGDTISAFDEFDTHNQFYGAQVGVRAEVWRNRFFANVASKVAFGVTNEAVDINGATTIIPRGGPATVSQGDLLTQSTNIGHFSRDVFSVVPEVDVNLGFQVTDNVRVFVGYSLLFWSGVVRPADQIDFAVNSTFAPTSLLPRSGPPAPLFNFHETNFWAQGVNVGVQLRF